MPNFPDEKKKKHLFFLLHTPSGFVLWCGRMLAAALFVVLPPTAAYYETLPSVAYHSILRTATRDGRDGVVIAFLDGASESISFEQMHQLQAESISHYAMTSDSGSFLTPLPWASGARRGGSAARRRGALLCPRMCGRRVRLAARACAWRARPLGRSRAPLAERLTLCARLPCRRPTKQSFHSRAMRRTLPKSREVARLLGLESRWLEARGADETRVSQPRQVCLASAVLCPALRLMWIPC